MHHLIDMITHTTTFVTPVVEHLLEREIDQWVHHEGSLRRPSSPWADALTTDLHLAPHTYIHTYMHASTTKIKNNKWKFCFTFRWWHGESSRTKPTDSNPSCYCPISLDIVFPFREKLSMKRRHSFGPLLTPSSWNKLSGSLQKHKLSLKKNSF